MFSSHQLQIIKDHFQYLVPSVKMFTPKDRQGCRRIHLQAATDKGLAGCGNLLCHSFTSCQTRYSL